MQATTQIGQRKYVQLRSLWWDRPAFESAAVVAVVVAIVMVVAVVVVAVVV